MEPVGLLAAGRGNLLGINKGGPRIGMSQGSRQLLEGFYNNASALFNQLFTSAENQEVNNIKTIMALRSKYSHLVSESITGTAASTTSGTQVDQEA
jgi:hypothetical protein